MEEKDPEEGPKEDPSEREPTEEDDPEENFVVSEGKMRGSDDVEGDSSESETEPMKKGYPEGDQEEGRMESIVQTDQMRGPENLSKETDPVEKRGESETGVTCWK